MNDDTRVRFLVDLFESPGWQVVLEERERVRQVLMSGIASSTTPPMPDPAGAKEGIMSYPELRAGLNTMDRFFRRLEGIVDTAKAQVTAESIRTNNPNAKVRGSMPN